VSGLLAQKSGCVLVTNIPAPYRNKVFSLVHSLPFEVFFCSKTEANRNWSGLPFAFKHRFLAGRTFRKQDGYNFVHHNFEVFKALSEASPSIVITTGFNPTHLYAFLWCVIHRVHHVCMTDGSMHSESKLSLLHRWVRRIVFFLSDAFIAASQSGVALYQSYGIPRDQIFRTYLCADNDRFFDLSFNSPRPYDVCFSGQFTEHKLPFFFADICRQIKSRLGFCKALVLGDGPLKNQFLSQLESYEIDFHYAGFLQQDDLPEAYVKAKLLLFPTLNDTWGVVANEAMAAGTPVITTPFAGVAHELVLDDVTGFVCDLDVNLWVDRALSVIEDQERWFIMSNLARNHVKEYTYQKAAEGIEAACAYVLTR